MSTMDDSYAIPSAAFTLSPEFLKYITTHVFLPLKPPDKSDYTPENDYALARVVCAAAHAFQTHVDETEGQAQWRRITKMLDNLQASVQSEHMDKDSVISQLRGMQTEDTLVFLIRDENTAIVFTKQEAYMLCEAFEAPPSEDDVRNSEGPLIRSYPTSSVKIPHKAFVNEDFQLELANFLSRANPHSTLSLPPPTDPQYTSLLLDSILRKLSHAAEVPRSRKLAVMFSGVLRRLGGADTSRITKRICDYVGSTGSGSVAWRRSPLWLLIRVAVQRSVTDVIRHDAVSYKQFVLFFMCVLAMDGNNTSLPSNALHLILVQLSRRLNKLHSSIPNWLSEMTRKSCTSLREILDARLRDLSDRPSLFRNPSQDELVRDTKLSLSNSREYIHNALENSGYKTTRTPFCPSHRRRGTLDDFLSDSDGTFFDEAYDADPNVALYDIERSIEQGIDDWLAYVTDVDEACIRLERLMDRYMLKGYRSLLNPEDRSRKLLTGIELYVAIDKLTVKEIPMLADYPPEIPILALEMLLLRKRSDLHRLSCAYQYLSARHSQSRRGWSVLSEDFTEDSFPVRYYNQSTRLQELRARIEQNATSVAEYADLPDERTQLRIKRPDAEPSKGQRTSEVVEERFWLPSSTLHTKVVIFELQCPPCIRVWRSAAIRVLHNVCPEFFLGDNLDGKGGYSLLARAPKLRSWVVQQGEESLHWQIHPAHFYPNGPDSPTLRYIFQYHDRHSERDCLSTWERDKNHDNRELSLYLHYVIEGPSELETYARYTSHTSNGILSAQADCPTDLSLKEFIAFAHLRSGSSLQWLNILQGLRSRSLNLRRPIFHAILASATFQVGPLDLDTGAWTWHQELEDISFCSSFLDELDCLFVDAGAGLVDSVLVGTISMLLTRILASSPTRGISERTITLLRKIRKKTFDWVQELSYDLAMAPMNRERRSLMQDMAATCRSTYDVDSVTMRELFEFAEDSDALLSCTLFLHTLPRSMAYGYPELIRGRDCCLPPAIEDALMDAILADPSDYGTDLAVGRIFVNYQPGTCRWEQLKDPNDCWLSCTTGATVDGQPLGGLPSKIWDSEEYQQVFCDQGFFVVPSDLPGMDFMTHSTSMESGHKEYKVHFSWRDKNLVIRAHRRGANDTLELIPWRVLSVDLPSVLVDGHVHWLNLETKILEIRPFEKLWVESSENWRINCASVECCAYKGHETLVDTRSSTWIMVSKCFECLYQVFWRGQPSNDDGWKRSLLIVASSIDSVGSETRSRLSATLSHHSLSFFVNERGEFESRDFKDMVYDKNQSLGALFGLENLLVIRPKSHFGETLIPEALIHRRALIPSGCPVIGADDRVHIDSFYRGINEALYYSYSVDTELGCLIGDSSLTSTLLLAYTHAMTNCHRPDPLTGKTGIQAALCLLRSAGCLSIMKQKALRIFGPWASEDHPEISAAFKVIRNRHYWDPRRIRTVETIGQEVHAAHREANLFASNMAIEETVHDVRGGSNEGTSSIARVSPNVGSPLRISTDYLITSRPTRELPGRCTPSLAPRTHTISSEDITSTLRPSLLSSLHTCSSFQRDYVSRLETSARALASESRTIKKMAEKDDIDALTKHYVQCRSRFLGSLDILKDALGPTTDSREQAIHQLGQWPPITADVLLRYLASTSSIDIPSDWKKCLTSLALLLSDLQRARRLLRFALQGLEEEVSKELENEGYDGWDPDVHPDWLLIQIQGNFLIRRAQIETAMQMLSPESRENAVMQVNMGEGKSSVIIPIVAAALADGKQLARIVVPKALTVQMYEILVARLGWLLNRPIYHLPFSRIPEYKYGEVVSLQIDDLHKLMSQCVTERGIVLVQPEHVVSLKLMAIEEQIRQAKLTTDRFKDGPAPVFRKIQTAIPLGSDSASKWLGLQKWLYSHARDILDESDEILHSRFQLVYTVGSQQPLDGYPTRWTITQQILLRTKKHLYTIPTYPGMLNSMVCQRGSPGSFPHIRILRTSDVALHLKSLIKEDIMTGQLPCFSFQHVPQAERDAIQSFISDENILEVPETAKRVEEYAKSSDQGHLWSGLLLLRGLLTSNILLFALGERRWRVDYGLDLGANSMLAVPYRAKDIPAPNTQFGHPDLTIILTCLSYYYAGLTTKQLKRAFEILLDQDHPTAEYALWINECDDPGMVPPSLRTLGDINLGSPDQWDNIILPLFSWNQATINFYLSQVVFPKEAKELPLKISGSSWDLGEKRKNPISMTGFSGTNDGQWLLPISINQQHLDHQKGTTAKVLAHLLRPENDCYEATHNGSERRTTRTLLQTIAKQGPEIRVLLDVGSQILDLSNDKVASEWLAIFSDAVGAIYFNKSDELVVLTRNGRTQPLRSSSLSEQLDRCVVYMDHAHTRGTDLNLPSGSRAAVTLGPKVTKDALVQGCMRMRKLGHGHSVMFFAPPEVDQKIRVVTNKAGPEVRVNTADVLCWAIHETWSDIESRAPYWAKQGMDHKSRYDAWSRFVSGNLSRKKLEEAWLQPDCKSLDELYSPYATQNTSSDLSSLDPMIRQRCKDLGVLSLPSAQLDEEQEREVHREREREREVELPPKAKPAKHDLHPAVVTFVKRGKIRQFSGFRPVFTTIERTSAAATEAGKWSGKVLATEDFCRVIEPKSTRGSVDQYCRPVQWILSRNKPRDPVLLLLSPFEADRLMPDIRASKYVHLHLYAPRTSERMRPCDDLQLYSIPSLPLDWIPPWRLIDELNIFAGQLYLRDYEAYVRVCGLLGVPFTKESRNDSTAKQNVLDLRGKTNKNKAASSRSLLLSVKALLAMREKGLPFSETHMGRLLQGQILTEKDFKPPNVAMTLPLP